MKRISLASFLISALFISKTITLDGHVDIENMDSGSENTEYSLSMGDEDSDDIAGAPMTIATRENCFHFPLYCEAIGTPPNFKIEPLETQLSDPMRPHVNAIIVAYNQQNTQYLRQFYNKIRGQNGIFEQGDEQTMLTIVAALTDIARQHYLPGEIPEQMRDKFLLKMCALQVVYRKKFKYFINAELAE